jgi:hypothetical protein
VTERSTGIERQAHHDRRTSPSRWASSIVPWCRCTTTRLSGDVVDLDPAFGEQFLHVAVDRPYRRYQRSATTITSAGSETSEGG